MDIRKLQRAIVDGLEDVKAQNIVVFNTEALSPLFERVIIASGTSNRQTKALASSVRETVKGRGMQVLRTEGEDNGEWIIVDCGAAVAHIMQPAIREYYHLEEIWGGKSVKLKAAEAQGLPKAGEAAARDVARAAQAAKEAKEAPARKGAAGKSASPVLPASAAARRAPAAKTPAAKSPVKSPTKARPKTAPKPATKTAAAKKPAAKTAAKTASKTAPGRKPAAKKSPARKTSR